MKRILIYLFALLALFSCRELEVMDYRFSAQIAIQSDDSLLYVGESAILELKVEDLAVKDPLFFSYTINGEKLLPLTLNDVMLSHDKAKLTERGGKYLLKFHPSQEGNYFIEYTLFNSIYSLSDTLNLQVYTKPIVKSFDIMVHSADTAYLKETTPIDIEFNLLADELKKVEMHYLINGDETLRLRRNGVVQSDTIEFNLSTMNGFVLEYTPEKPGKHTIHMSFNDQWGYVIDTTLSILSEKYRKSFINDVKYSDVGYINDTTEIGVSFLPISTENIYMDYEVFGPVNGLYLAMDGHKVSKTDNKLNLSEQREYLLQLIPPAKGDYTVLFFFRDDIGYTSSDTLHLNVNDYKETFKTTISSEEEVFIADTTVIESTFTSVCTDKVFFSYDIVGPQGNVYLYENEERVPKDPVERSIKEFSRLEYNFIAPDKTGLYTIYMTYQDIKGYSVSDTIEINVPGYEETFMVEVISPEDAFIADSTFFDLVFESVKTEAVQMSYKINGSSQLKLYRDTEILSSKSILEIGEGSSHRFGFVAKKEGDYSIEIKLSDSKGYTIQEVIIFSISTHRKTFDIETSISEVSYIADSTYIELYFDEVLVDEIMMDYRINGSTQQKLYHNGSKMMNKASLLEISNGSIISLSYIPPKEGSYQIDLTFYDAKGYTYKESFYIDASEYRQSFNVSVPAQIITNIMHPADIELNFTSVECSSVYYDYTINGSNVEKLTYMGETLPNSGNKLTPGIVQNFIIEYTPSAKGTYNIDFRFYDEKGYSITKSTVVTADDYKKTFDVDIATLDTVNVGSSNEIDIIFSNIDTDEVIMDYSVTPSSVTLHLNGETLSSNHTLDLQSYSIFPVTITPHNPGIYNVSFTFKDAKGYLTSKAITFVSVLGSSFDYDVSSNDIYLDQSAAIALQFKNINTEKVYLSYKIATAHNNGIGLTLDGSPITSDMYELSLTSQKSYILSFDPISPEEKITVSISIADEYGYIVEKEISFKINGYEETFKVLLDSQVSTNIYYPASINLGFSDLKTDKIHYNYSINGSAEERLTYKGNELSLTDNTFDVSVAKNYTLEYTPEKAGNHQVNFEFFDSRGYILKTGTTVVASGYKNTFSVSVPQEIETDIMYPAEFDVVFSDIQAKDIYMDYSINGSDTQKLYYQGSAIPNTGYKFSPGIINVYTLSYTPTVPGTSNIGFRFYDEKGFEQLISAKILAEHYRKTFDVDISSPGIGYISQESDITLKFIDPSVDKVYLDYSINHNTQEKLTYSGNTLNPQKQTIDLSLNKEFTIQYVPTIIGNNIVSVRIYDDHGYSRSYDIIIPALEWGEAKIKDSDLSMTLGETHSLSYTTSPSSMSYSFTSSNPDIASVTAKGKITAKGVGSSFIKLTLANGVSDSIKVNVHAPVAQYEVMAVCSPSVGGSITGIGKYTYGQTATLTVNAEEGYIFRRWDDNDTSNPRTINITSAIVRTAYLDKLCSSVSLTPSEVTLYRGEEVQLTATVLPDNANNKAVTWSSSDNTIATVSSTGMVTTHKKGDVVITATAQDESQASSSAVIKVIPNKYNVHITSEKGGITTPSGTFEVEENSELEISAIAKDHYTFKKWSDGETSSERTITITSDTTLIAEMTPNNYTLKISVYPEDAEQITGSGEYPYGETVTITATNKNSNYVFSHWLIDGVRYDTAKVDITITGDTHAEAHYNYAVRSLVISTYQRNLQVGNAHNFIATISPSEAANQSVIWSITPDCGTFNNTEHLYSVFTPQGLVGPAQIRCVSAENPSVSDSKNVLIYADVTVSFTEMVESGESTLYVICDQEVSNAQITVMYIDDTGNSQTQALPIVTSPQKITTFNPDNGYLVEQVTSNSEYVTVIVK